MTDEQRKKWLLAAAICLAPGGFILGATLAANHYRKKVADSRKAAADEAGEGSGASS
jgi:hypothetical protein